VHFLSSRPSFRAPAAWARRALRLRVSAVTEPSAKRLITSDTKSLMKSRRYCIRDLPLLGSADRAGNLHRDGDDASAWSNIEARRFGTPADFSFSVAPGAAGSLHQLSIPRRRFVQSLDEDVRGRGEKEGPKTVRRRPTVSRIIRRRLSRPAVRAACAHTSTVLFKCRRRRARAPPGPRRCSRSAQHLAFEAATPRTGPPTSPTRFEKR